MGDRDRNVGRLDRAIRVPLGVAAAMATGWILLTYPVQPGTIALTLLLTLFVPIMFISAATGTCGVYKTLGIDTAPHSIDESPEQVWYPS